MITDEAFKQNLDKAFKDQGFLKKERNKLIENYLLDKTIDRDNLLDIEERKARDVVAKKKFDKLIPLEKTEQINLVSEFKRKYPDVVIFMARNDGFRTKSEKAEQLLLGLHKGVSDLVIPEFRIFLEMKRIKNSKWSEEQQEFKRYVESIGYYYVLGYGCDDALEKIDKTINNRYNKHTV
jgi:hypothetical protein